MDVISATSAIVGLAVPVFQSANALRDRIKLVASEKSELLAALTEYEKDINLLESLYNDNKELFDQHNLDTDLKELAGIIRDVDEWLNSIDLNLGKKKFPGLQALWRAGDLHKKLVASNAKISSVRTRWETRLNVSTLASTNVILGQMDSAQAQTNVTLGRMESTQTEIISVIQQVLTMVQQAPVRQRSRSLSMHSQVVPVGFNSQTTRIVANTTTSTVTFSILSPDPSLSYDSIKLRLEEYRTLLTSDSDTMEFCTESGKTLICRKEEKEMEAFLDQAEILLRGVIQSRDISTVVVLHHLRDLAEVLDKLNLDDECRLTGNCALDLAETLGRQSLESKQEQAETLARIAGLPVYQPRARTLFIQAVSICEEVVANNASHSNKHALLNVLERAGYWAPDDLCAKWLGRAIQLMTKELPLTMVHPGTLSVIYYNYGFSLAELRQYDSAVEAYDEAISIRRILSTIDTASHNFYLAQALRNKGMTLTSLGRYDDAIVAYKEALGICTTMSAQEPLQYNELMAKTLTSYGTTLGKSNQFSEAAAIEKQAISLYRNLAQTGHECTKLLCDTLHNYGNLCYALGKHEESVRAYQESILLRRALAATDSKERSLILGLHSIVRPLLALGRHAEANAAANEALERNHGRVLEGCPWEPDFKSCFVCQRAKTPDSPPNDSPPLPFLLANSSSPPAEDHGADASLTPAETPIPTGETVNASVHKRGQNILGFFSRNRAQ